MHLDPFGKVSKYFKNIHSKGVVNNVKEYCN